MQQVIVSVQVPAAKSMSIKIYIPVPISSDGTDLLSHPKHPWNKLMGVHKI